MKILNNLFILLVAVSLLAACNNSDDNEVAGPETGEMRIKFENVVGHDEDGVVLSLEDKGSTNYPYTSNSGQSFNIHTFRYYISNIKLEGPDGEVYLDEMQVSPDAAGVKGYYLVLAEDASSQSIVLKGIPAGKYNKITFTVGIPEEGVQEGAAGGILDPAEGAWFWNWNAGYIAFGIEGASSESGEAGNPEFEIPEKSFAVHVGGWKDVIPAEGETQKFVNNLKTITLDFDSHVTVSKSLRPEPHILVDVLEMLGDIDFSSTYAVHSPAKGKTFADNIPNAFIFDHVHQ